MGLFGLFNKTDINDGIQQFESTEGAYLIDVRTPGEYNEGHIPKSVNIPLQNIDSIETMSIKMDSPLFLHCLSGSRSAQAVSYLKQKGFRNVTDIGGIERYKGRIER